MRILVTGAAGFIGSHVCERLAKEHSIVGIDNFDPYYDVGLKQENVARIEQSISFVQADFTDTNVLALHMKDVDIVIHLGAKAGVRASLQHPLNYIHTNITGTQTVLNVAKQCGVNKVVFASSSSVYGDRTQGPFNEDDDIGFQQSPYAATKRTGESLCYLASIEGLPCVCLRFFTVYGPFGRPDMAPMSFFNNIVSGKSISVYGDGSMLRDYTYVGDVVEGIYAAAFCDTGNFSIFNLGKGQPNTVLELVEAIEQSTGKQAVKQFVAQPSADVGLTYADITRARKVLGYNPTVSLQEGISRMVAQHF